MIFVSVGTQLPFERLVRAVDEWCRCHPGEETFAQIGDTRYRPRYMEYVVKLSPRHYAEKLDQASLIVSHVGMGTIISALEHAKPQVLMPRLAAMGEHRSDHQLSTAAKFTGSALIDIVRTEQELGAAISRRLQNCGVHCAKTGGVETSPELLARIRGFVSAE